MTQLGEIIRDEIWANPVMAYMGMLSDDGDFEGDDEGDEGEQAASSSAAAADDD